MTLDEFARLRELCEKATSGPWKARHRHIDGKDSDDEIAGLGWEIEGPPDPLLRGQFAKAADAHLMAAARTAVPALLDEVERLRKALEDDGSGQPVSVLLSDVADYLGRAGGGPMEDRVRYVLRQINAALNPH